MITRQKGLLRPPAKSDPQAGAADERERLRRELLERILERELRRQAVRGCPR